MALDINKKIYSGIYRRYDGTEIQVIISAKNIDTGEEMLVCKRQYHGKPEDYFTISKASFCETVDSPDGSKPKFTRQTQHREDDAELEYFHDLGFDQKSRLKRRHRRDTTDEYPVVRILHASENYLQYARELCEYHLADTRRVKLCMYGSTAESFPSRYETNTMSYPTLSANMTTRFSEESCSF